ncbi:MAG: ABC transporter substrate-binding protein [Streptosporangiales bacterium]
MDTPRRPSRRELLQGAAGVGAAAALAGCGTLPPARADDRGGLPRRGGLLRIGAAGGGSNDTLDAHAPRDNTDIMRAMQLYEPLLARTHSYGIEPAVAESVEPAADGMAWTVRIRAGLTFHDGRPVRPEDVIFSLRRITDPRRPRAAATLLAPIDRDRMRKLDARTVQIPLRWPDRSLREVFCDYRTGIVPADYDPKRPVGTGPFRYVAFDPGRRSVFRRFHDYWRNGEPYVDELRIANLSGDAARVNALLAGDADAVESVPYGEVPVVRADPRSRLLVAKTGNWQPFTMRVDEQPFGDQRVRQALRLCVDRQRMVEQVMSGHGRVGNDLYAPFDPCYAGDLPQREHDPDKARSLLAAAGADGLRVRLATSPVAPGMVRAARELRDQARRAGVRVEVAKVAGNAFYGDGYLERTFGQDAWSTWPYLVQATLGSLPRSPFNECHWTDPDYLGLIRQARRSADDRKRSQYLQDAQRIEWERGGYIIWGFGDTVDAYSRRIAGLRESRTGFPLGGYAFRKVWFA